MAMAAEHVFTYNSYCDNNDGYDKNDGDADTSSVLHV